MKMAELLSLIIQPFALIAFFFLSRCASVQDILLTYNQWENMGCLYGKYGSFYSSLVLPPYTHI